MVPAGLDDCSAEEEKELNTKRKRVQQVQKYTIVADQPESGAAQTGPRVSESASSDVGCEPQYGEICVGERVFDRMVAASLGGSSSGEEEDPTPKRRRLRRGNQITTGDVD